MKFLISLLKPAPYIPEMEDKEAIQKLFPYWRYRILYAIFIGYAFYYFTRKSYTFAMPGLIEELHFDKGQIGILGSIFSISYGISKFASGMLSDCSSPRYFMAIGLFMTGVCNILFGLSSSLLFFALFWGFNGWFQGFGAPPCVRFLTQWYSHTERGSWWSTWSTSHNIGAFLIPWVVGWSLQIWGWRYAMYIPGCICLFGSFFLINRLRDTPQSIGLPSIEHYRNDHYTQIVETDTPQSFWTIFSLYILKNKYIWLFFGAYFFIYFLRMGIGDWTALFLIEKKGYSLLSASGSVSLFEVGGIVGGLSAGWTSDKFFGAKRGPVNILYSVAIIGALFFFMSVPKGYPLIDSISIFLLGFSIYGPQLLIGVAAAEATHKRAVSTSNGFVGLGAYLGAAAAGFPLGRIADKFGWEGYFWTLVGSAVMALVLLMPMWSLSKQKTPIEANT